VTGRRSDYDKAVERIAAKYRQLDTALSRASEKNAHDYRVARDATLDVLTLVIAGQTTDHGTSRTASPMAAHLRAAELIEQEGQVTP
jgi:hypothetical protein